MTFAEALAAMRLGKRVRRSRWNNGALLFMVTKGLGAPDAPYLAYQEDVEDWAVVRKQWSSASDDVCVNDWVVADEPLVTGLGSFKAMSGANTRGLCPPAIRLTHPKQHGPNAGEPWEAVLTVQDKGDYPDSSGLATEADLRAAGFVRPPSPDDPAAVERFAERVHEAWMQQKQAQGFADHPHRLAPFTESNVAGVYICVSNYSKVCCLLPADKHHHDMRPYADLDEPTKEYDRATARAVLAALPDYRAKE